MKGPGDRRPEPFDIEVGLRVRMIRKAKGLTQVSLAEAAGVTFQQVQKYERGTNRISCSMLKRISEFLGVSMSELLGETSSAETGRSQSGSSEAPASSDS